MGNIFIKIGAVILLWVSKLELIGPDWTSYIFEARNGVKFDRVEINKR